MKKILIAIIILIVIIASLWLYNNLSKKSSLETTNTVEDITIIHKNFRAIMPENWTENENSPLTYIYLPPNANPEDKKVEVISIVISPLGENNMFTLDEILKLGIENSKKIMPDFELIENIDGGKPDMPGKRIKFSGTQDGIKRSHIQSFGIKYNNLYTLSYSCPINNCHYNNIYENLLTSFEPHQD